ncbi:MAG: aminoacyl-tRNA hydrolase [Flavobacterium sp.]|nr:aminoacyl-tRNA hydrolase [Flavobacterium sp.]
MNKEIILSEINYKAVRSSGAGGQNVNKVSSKIQLAFDLNNSQGLDYEEKQLVLEKLSNRLTTENILILNCDEDRSQLKNKTIITKRFLELIKNALLVPKERKETKVPKGVVEKRLSTKKSTAEIKGNRKKPDIF